MSKDHTADITALTGETMALQAVVAGLLIGFVKSGHPGIAKGALDYADTLTEAGALFMGAQGNRDITAKMIEVIDSLRKAALD